MSGKILIICGVSGSGKSTISDAITNRHDDVVRAVAVTTRTPRAGERYAYHYYFVDKNLFSWLCATEQLLEYTEVYNGHSYGTLRLAVDQALEKGHDVLFVVDSVGVERIREAYPNARSVFLKAPSDAEQRARLTARGTVGEELEERVAKAHQELTWATTNEIPVVTNEDVAQTVRDVEDIFGLTVEAGK